MKVTLKNKFHGTEVNVITEAVYNSGVVAFGGEHVGGDQFCVLTKSQTRRADKALCGISDCSCDLPTGVREIQTRHGIAWSFTIDADQKEVLDI